MTKSTRARYTLEFKEEAVRQSTQGDAAWFATVHPAAVAGIAQDVMIVPGIADGQFTATPSAAQNTGEQGIPALGRAPQACRVGPGSFTPSLSQNWT